MRMLFLSAMVFLMAAAHAEEVLPSAAARDASYNPGHLATISVDGKAWEYGDTREEVERAAPNYNLHIKLLTSTGYVKNAGHGVTIKDAHGKDLHEEQVGGPLYLVNLDPGTYQIEATYAEITKTQTVTLEATGRKEIVFRWDE